MEAHPGLGGCGGGGVGDVECSENSMNHRDGPGKACMSLSLIASAVELHDLTSVAIGQILKRPKCIGLRM